MLRAFLDEPGVGGCTSLRHVVCSGEALPVELKEAFFARLGGRFNGAQLHNLYGPTEAAVDVTFWRCEPDARLRSVPIGRAIANTQIQIVDEALRQVAVGVPGEILIGGIAVGRGYQNRAALTAQKFIPDPFSGSQGARLYRTGDLGRYRCDGAIEFLGRIDEQVKLRGYRIELGEIESVLAQHEGVCQAVAGIREGRLLAWVVLAEGQAGQPEQWRAFLQARLPEYMAPAAFLVVESMPLTGSGKIDRRALPAPQAAFSSSDYLAPRTPAEEILAGIWAQVLKVDRVGIHDNFFALGGDSILSIRIGALARKAGLQFSLAQLFQHQTVATLAATATMNVAPSVHENELEGLIPLTPIQHWFFERQLNRPDHVNQSILLQAATNVDAAELRHSFLAAVAHHQTLALRFEQDTAGVWQQVYHGPERSILFSYVDLSAIPRQVRRAAFELGCDDAQRSLNLRQGPLLRAVWWKLRSDDYRLLLIIHHLIIDGVSWRILLDDFRIALEQRRQNEPLLLPSRTTPWGRWSRQLTRYASDPRLQRERFYWLDRCRRSAAIPPLAVDYPETNNVRAEEATITIGLNATDTEALLREIPRSHSAGIEEILLTAVIQTIGAWTRQPSVLLDVEGHGREEAVSDGLDVSHTIGWFTSIYPALIPFHADPERQLDAVQQWMKDVPNRGIGYGILRYLRPDGLELATASQIVFNYLGQFDQSSASEMGFSPAPERTGCGQDRSQQRPYLIEIVASVSAGKLHINWTYNQSLHRRDTIMLLAQSAQASITHFTSISQAAVAGCR
jgi:non-ribosomal peptide synthase protein (TIGR01720 family)